MHSIKEIRKTLYWFQRTIDDMKEFFTQHGIFPRLKMRVRKTTMRDKRRRNCILSFTLNTNKCKKYLPGTQRIFRRTEIDH